MSDFKKTGKFVAVCGNIGAGKSTYIKQFLKDHPDF